MLLEFSVTNFKAIAGTQKLSMVATGEAISRRGRVFETGNPVAPAVLKSACVLGPNGSGKTSLIKALSFFVSFVRHSSSGMTEGDEIDVVPFKFDAELEAAPSEFEALFIFEDVLYQYGFVADRERVFEEWLFARPNEPSARMRTMFQRQYSEADKDYIWNINDAHIKGEREVWRKATRGNALFLSTAVQLNSETLRHPFRWLTNYLKIIPSPDRMSADFTARLCEDPSMKDDVLRFLRAADLGIQDVAVIESDVTLPKEIESFFNEASLKLFRETKDLRKKLQTHTFHYARDGSLTALQLEEESDGTRVIFSLAGPLLSVLRNGYTLVIDELHNSLHPTILKYLVSLFHRERTNSNRAQLLFSTHDTSVLSRNLMHRDQIWMVEKVDSAAHFYPLSDFKVRDGDFSKGYLDGAFGGLPHPREFDLGPE